MILADTDVLIDYLTKSQPTSAQVLGYLEAGTLLTSAITAFELLTGAGPDKRGDQTRQLLEHIVILPIDKKAAEQAAFVRRHLERSGKGIAMGDSLIAGLALSQNMPLLTRNHKHFARVPDLGLVLES